MPRVLVGDPAGVDAVHVDTVAHVVRGGGPRHHVERGLGHVRVRVLVGLEATVELPLHRRDVDDVLVALGRARASGLSRALSTNGATALTSCTSSSSTVGTSDERHAPRVDVAQVDLLQIGVEPALGKNALTAREILGKQRHLREHRGLAQAGARAGRRWRQSVRSLTRRSPAQRVVALEQRARVEPAACVGVGSSLSTTWRVETRRPAHGLTGVVDDEVEPVGSSSRWRASRSTLGVWRRSMP